MAQIADLRNSIGTSHSSCACGDTRRTVAEFSPISSTLPCAVYTRRVLGLFSSSFTRSAMTSGLCGFGGIPPVMCPRQLCSNMITPTFFHLTVCTNYVAFWAPEGPQKAT